jgi:CheY-like chemotaxis protein
MPSKPSILVVDDSSDSREMLTEYLGYRGVHVAQARNGTLDTKAVALKGTPRQMSAKFRALPLREEANDAQPSSKKPAKPSPR